MNFVAKLLRDGEPSTRYRLALAGLGGDPVVVRAQIPRSERVKTLLSQRGSDGRIPQHPYTKWTGAHWVLVALAELGYPPGDPALLPLRDQVLDWIFDPRRNRPRRAGDDAYLAPILTVAGRTRIHAAIEGNALFAILALGLADPRADRLAIRLTETQWADGGWNCDRKPKASTSSFEETLIPLRGLIWHAKLRDPRTWPAARRAAEVLLTRSLFRRRSSGAPIAPQFQALHWPRYWHYDVLGALEVLVEGGLVDERCDEALAWLESRRRADGGFPMDNKYWGGPTTPARASLVKWGPTGSGRSNEFVTAAAVQVLAAVGRIPAGT